MKKDCLNSFLTAKITKKIAHEPECENSLLHKGEHVQSNDHMIYILSGRHNHKDHLPLINKVRKLL